MRLRESETALSRSSLSIRWTGFVESADEELEWIEATAKKKPNSKKNRWSCRRYVDGHNLRDDPQRYLNGGAFLDSRNPVKHVGWQLRYTLAEGQFQGWRLALILFEKGIFVEKCGLIVCARAVDSQGLPQLLFGF